MTNDVFDNNVFFAILLCKLFISLSLSLSLPPGISDDISAESITVSSNCPVRITVLITARPDNLLSLSLSLSLRLLSRRWLIPAED